MHRPREKRAEAVTRTTVALDGSILGWGPGGIPRYLRNVLVHLAEDPELSLEVLANSRTEVVGIPGITEHDIRLTGGLAWRTAVLSAHLYRHRPDVFWLPTPTVPRYLPHPYVTTVHDLSPVIFPATKPRSAQISFGITFRKAVTRADQVIAVSEATADDLCRVWGIPEERITVVPLGVSENFRRGDPLEARRRLEARFGLQGDFALVVGTVEERKGLEVAIEIAEASTDWKIVFVGRRGFGHGPIVSRGENAGARFLGEVSDDELVDLYRSAEMLLLPSIYEGFGLPALEAMASGCPVVIAGNSGSLDQIYGDAAMVVEDRSPTAWISAMKEVRSERERFVQIGGLLAARFTWQASAQATAEVLKRAVSQFRGS
jgi:glycosyltransferase involved in cell wall biosynthesis